MTITVPISLLFHLLLLIILLSANILNKPHSKRINTPISAINVNIVNLPDERPSGPSVVKKDEKAVKVEEIRKVEKAKEAIKIKEPVDRSKKSEVRSKKLEMKKEKAVEKPKVVEKAKVVIPEPVAKEKVVLGQKSEEVAQKSEEIEQKADMQTKETLNPQGNEKTAGVQEAKLTTAPPVASGPVADIPDFKYDYYLDVIRDKVDNRWSQPRRYTQIKQALIEFTIRRNGEVGKVDVAESSGDPYFDQTAIRAVSLSNPFPPLPRGYKEDSLHIRYRFIFGRKG